jgi:hypothetical protein
MRCGSPCADRASGRCRRRPRLRARRAKERIDDDALVGDLETRTFRETDRRAHPDAEDHEVGGEPRAVREHDAVALDGTRCAAEVEDHAVLLVELLEERAPRWSEDALQRTSLRRDHVHLEPRARSDAATSSPMKLAPTTTARLLDGSRSRSHGRRRSCGP